MLEVVRRTAVGAEQMGVSVAVTVVGELGRLDVVVVLVEGHVDAVARVGGGDGGQRWVIAILKKNQLPTTLPIASILSSWHYQLK